MNVASLTHSLWKTPKGLHAIGFLPAVQSAIFRSAKRGESLPPRMVCAAEVPAAPSLSTDLMTSSEMPTEEAIATIGVVLSNRYCRYLAIPWNDALLSDGDAAAYLLRSFIETYGENTHLWEITCPDEAYGRPRVACAIEKILLAGIQASCAGHGRELTFVRPYFAVAFNRFRAQMAFSKGILAVVEDHTLTVGRWAAGSMIEIDVLPCESGWQASLAAWVARNALLEDALGNVFVLCPPGWIGDADLDPKSTWTLLTWPETLAACVAENPALALPACAL